MSARGPRVLLSGVVLGQPMGGVRRHNQELLPRVARQLAARGGSLTVMEGRTPLAFPLPPGIERVSSGVPARPALVRATLEGRWLRRHVQTAQLEERPFDLIHTAHMPVPRALPLPFALTLHDLKVLQGAHTPMSRRLIGRKVVGEALERAAVVLAVSEALRAEILENFRVEADRVRVVPNAADHLTLLPREDARPDAPLLCVGHLEPRKNVELLLHALHHDPGLPRLQVAGAPVGDGRERLEHLAGVLGVSDRVELLGLVDDEGLARLYARAACVVLPSRREGFCIPAAEARRARAPLAVAQIPALLEVAGEGVPSFHPDDAAQCAEAIRRALETPPEELERAGARAEAMRWDDAAQRWVEAWTLGLERARSG